MEIGDRVKVVRIDAYTRYVYAAEGIPNPVGEIGIVTEMRYNHNMKIFEVSVLIEGTEYIFERWQLMKII